MLAMMIIALAVQDAPPEISSVYTEMSDCVEIAGPALVNESCDGYGGWTVLVSASDHSAGLAYSDRARDEQFAQRPITDGQFQSFERTLEWRVRRHDQAWIPFATIHRWRSGTQVVDADTGAFTGEVETNSHLLVVTALRPEGPIGACHAAYVDVREVYEANIVARQFADAMADAFRCGIDAPYVIGAGEAARLMERGRL